LFGKSQGQRGARWENSSSTKQLCLSKRPWRTGKEKPKTRTAFIFCCFGLQMEMENDFQRNKFCCRSAKPVFLDNFDSASNPGVVGFEAKFCASEKG
jgi:hypothetical protein